jgi:hypothetical protein
MLRTHNDVAFCGHAQPRIFQLPIDIEASHPKLFNARQAARYVLSDEGVCFGGRSRTDLQRAVPWILGESARSLNHQQQWKPRSEEALRGYGGHSSHHADRRRGGSDQACGHWDARRLAYPLRQARFHRFP